ncbi:MAG: 16S rRNA (uracil(1498)-N(3))-methyltransferase, partial [Prevotellaceae bacterium]|nr:16S rRNA (uracil(1498)-N(3))-methyltransferase [Prevotellaceae bacterium]
MHLFYTPDIHGVSYTLNEEESKHCSRVLRLNIGDRIYLIDGKGGFYTAEILNSNPKHCAVKIVDKKTEYGKRSYYLHIAIAPTKNIERYEWFLEKATEIGTDEITPIISRYSERKMVRDDRSEKIVTAAVKQSLKAYHPKLNSITPFDELIKTPFEGKKLIAHCHDVPKENLKTALSLQENVLILIGPEGDFSMKEVEMAKKKT